jgi:glyoxylase I family protein
MIAVEHVAWQVEDPVAVAKWYGENLGFRILRHVGGPANTHFILDAAGRVVVEIYHNPAAAVPDYRSIHPLHLHLAFAAENLEQDRDRLLKAGATVAEEMITTPAGDKLIMLRDPFGFPIQLCKRANAMI